ncbi:MAG TPA: hypothetical protein PLL69_00480 [Gemmatimonadales bacterium]|nr:hypothetical protein [Gemmatimonadales bacterium]
MSDGITKHENRDDLHGVTVVISGASGRTYVGRWHERQPRGVVLRDVAVLESGNDVNTWLAKLEKFGVPPEQRLLVVPSEEVGEVRKLV